MFARFAANLKLQLFLHGFAYRAALARCPSDLAASPEPLLPGRQAEDALNVAVQAVEHAAKYYIMGPHLIMLYYIILYYIIVLLLYIIIYDIIVSYYIIIIL
jgi:hypothetical protein